MPIGSAGASEVLVSREVRIRASAPTVFEFLVDPAKLVRWMGTQAVLDPRPGGIYHVSINGYETVSGRFVEVVPFSRVVFTWGWDDGALATAPGSSTVEIDLEAEGDDTLLRLTHRGLTADMRRFHAAGWNHHLGRLATVAAGGDAGRDPHRTTLGSVRLGARTLPPRYLYRFPARRLALWLRRRRRRS